MKIAIVNAYDRHNAGDAALLSVLIDQARQACPHAMVSFAGLEDPARHRSFEGARNVGSIRRWAGDESVTRIRRVGRKAAAVSLCLLPGPALLWLSRHPPGRWLGEPLDEVRTIGDADLVVGLGGGYLNGTPSLAGTLNVLFLLVPLWVAIRLGAPTLLAPQSYGPFGNRVQTFMVRTCLNRVDRIVVRENVSLVHLRQAGVHPTRLQRGVDSAFALTDDATRPPGARSTSDCLSVGITVRAWLAGSAQERYERSLACFIDWLHEERGATVTLFPQVTAAYGHDDDRFVARRVAAHCVQAPTMVDRQLDFRQLRSLYRDLDYMVGTRFHSVIFSLTVGTPAVAIAYEHKTSGIMEELGLASWVIPIDEVTTETLRHRFCALEAAASDYQVAIKEVLPAYTERAQSFVDVLRAGLP